MNININMENINGLIIGKYDVLTPADIKNIKHFKNLCSNLTLALEESKLSFNDRKDFLLSVKYINRVILFSKEASFFEKHDIDILFLNSNQLNNDYKILKYILY